MKEQEQMQCQCCGNKENFRQNEEWFICKSCGVWFRYKTEEERRGCADGYRNLKKYKFEDAQEDFETVISKNPKSIDARWGLLLARFGVVFIKGFFDNVTEPIYCFPEYDELEEGVFCKQREYGEIMAILNDIISNPNTSEDQKKKAIETRYLYAAKAKKIDRAIKKFSESKRITENDVFICVKISAATEKNPQLPGETYDSIVAQELYNEMSAQGIKAFYSYETLHNNVDSDDLIWLNLVKSRKMILIGSSLEYLESAWVKSEWKRWKHLERLEDMYIVVLKHNNEYPKEVLPHELRKLQIYTLDTYREKLIPHICESLAQKTPETEEQILARYEAFFKTKFQAEEEARQAEVARQAEATRQAEASRQAEAARRTEAKRRAAEEVKRKAEEEAKLRAEEEAKKDGKIVYKDGRTKVLKYGITRIQKDAYKNNKDIVSVVLPSSVTTIGNSDFSDCSSLTSITIPDSVTTINTLAFSGCSSLTSITIPDSVTLIGEWAFASCSSLTSITIPDSVTSIGDHAFWNCSSLASITIPDSVTSIGEWAFASCSSFTSITIPGSVTSIGDSAFYKCSSFTSITIPNSVTSIGNNPFEGCELQLKVSPANKHFKVIDGNLYSIDGQMIISYIPKENEIKFSIPYGVTTIGNSAFSGCSSLASVTIPNSVTEIDDYAFSGCSSLKDIYYGGSIFAWAKIKIGKDGNGKLNGKLPERTKIHYNSK